MKPFRQLLVGSAACGLLSPLAVSASELNLDGVNRYVTSDDQVTSINQFSDVNPTDWAYPGSLQPDRALRLRGRLSRRHLPGWPGDDPL